MNPIKFKEVNCTYAENQPQYRPLPTHKDRIGTVTSCWQLTWKERLRVLFTGELWLQQLTFNQPLQPQLPSTVKPL